jgi:MYXO-CTERM domain-containing protein
MRRPISPARLTLAALALTVVTGMPAAAQANTNTTSTSGVIAQDTVRRPMPDNDSHFPWGLLGLLGLAGLMGRRKVETVRTVPPSTGRPGDPPSRM